MKFNRSEIMRNAWNIRRESGCTMSIALKKAWAVAKKGNKMFTEETLKNFIRCEKYNFDSHEEALKTFSAGLNIPTITGRSDKQVSYAESLRNRVLYNMMYATNDYMELIFEAMCVRSLSPEELADNAKEYNETVEEYIRNYIAYNSSPEIYLALTECDAGKLIDGLR